MGIVFHCSESLGPHRDGAVAVRPRNTVKSFILMWIESVSFSVALSRPHGFGESVALDIPRKGSPDGGSVTRRYSFRNQRPSVLKESIVESFNEFRWWSVHRMGLREPSAEREFKILSPNSGEP